jgi:hypothetical protein
LAARRSVIGDGYPRILRRLCNPVADGVGDRRRDATGRNTDIVTVARGAGIENSRWVRDQAHFDELMDRRFDESGPVFIAAKIDNQPGIGQTVRDPALIRHRFMQGLESGRRSALDD